MASAYDNVGWATIEEAVIRDKGYNEEAVLTSILRSYLVRGGFVDTLVALNEEVAELEPPNKTVSACLGVSGDKKVCSANDAQSKRVEKHVSLSNARKSECCGERNCDCTVSATSVLDGVRKRKQIQLMCRSGQYEAAAALISPKNEMRVRLLIMEAMKCASTDPSVAILFLTTRVAPLISSLPNPTRVHQIFVEALSVAAGLGGSGVKSASPCAVAREVNEALLGDDNQSALDVLLTWSAWQAELHRADVLPMQRAGSP
ncbi:hypothetical protein ERJ75_001459200 [Trypanosoma vivax]|nr:hypothetical protein TRVL_04224 [Trypanosoma vivax]KAH8606898.1 hypothetical protein ERJ75_001459200 [Trypanosoma vivax]